MKLKDIVSNWEPAAKLGGWLYAIAAAIVAVAAWVTTTQLAIAGNTSSIQELRQHVAPIEAIRQDVRWIKKRLGGPTD